MDGPPHRDSHDDARDWFAPPPAQPSDITLSGPLPAPVHAPAPGPLPIPVPGTLRPPHDMRVWPPAPETEDRSTQPFPAVRESRPLPPQHRTAPPAPPAAAPVAAQAPAKTPRRRTALLGAGAALSVALAVALPGWFGYSVYEYGQPRDVVHLVPHGQAGVWQHVSWQVTLDRIPDPTGKPAVSDRQWVKVVATRTALDGEGAIRHGAPEVQLTDRAGRKWRTEELSNETPPEAKDNKIGTPFRMELVGVVPPSVADQVEVLLRPNTYREVPEQSVSDIFKDAVKTEEKPDQVLRFLR